MVDLLVSMATVYTIGNCNVNVWYMVNGVNKSSRYTHCTVSQVQGDDQLFSLGVKEMWGPQKCWQSLGVTKKCQSYQDRLFLWGECCSTKKKCCSTQKKFGLLCAIIFISICEGGIAIFLVYYYLLFTTNKWITNKGSCSVTVQLFRSSMWLSYF